MMFVLHVFAYSWTTLYTMVQLLDKYIQHMLNVHDNTGVICAYLINISKYLLSVLATVIQNTSVLKFYQIYKWMFDKKH